MATIKLYLDSRRENQKGVYPLKICVTHRCKTRYVDLGIKLRPQDWDAAKERVKPAVRQSSAINAAIAARMAEARSALAQCRASATVDDIKRAIAVAIGLEDDAPQRNTLADAYDAVMSIKTGKSLEGYATSRKRVGDFVGPRFSDMPIDEVTPAWLMRFDAWMVRQGLKVNTRASYMRYLRATINYAAAEGKTEANPFRKFSIKKGATAKRSLAVEDIRKIASLNLEGCIADSRDLFILSFCLCGMNLADMLHLPPGADRSGRIRTERQKTGVPIDMAVQPEAQAIIDKHRGDEHMLRFLDGGIDYISLRQRINKNLKKLGEAKIVSKHGRIEREPIYPGLSTYWARHSWATIAAELDIPKDTIAAALAHADGSVTGIYIDFNMRKVDAANRRVLDCVFGAKKGEA